MDGIYNHTLDELEKPANISLILTIVWLITEQFAPTTPAPLLIGQYAETMDAELEQKDLIEEVLKRTSNTADLKYIVKSDSYDVTEGNYDFGFDSMDDEEYFYRSCGKKDKAIWFIDGIKSFNYLETDLLKEREHYNRNGFFCIVYTGRESDRLRTVRNIFHRLFGIYVININLLLFDGETIDAYTYFPFKLNECHHSSPHHIGSLGPSTNFKFSSEEFFVRKLSNMWGCNLTVTTWHEPPFIIIEKNQMKGIEGLLLLELSNNMNFTINIKAPSNKDRGAIYPNLTTTGATKMLVERETNITIISLMYDNNRLKVAEAAYTYLSAPVVVGLSKGRHMTPFERLLRPFKYIIWSCLSSSIFIGIVMIFTLKYYFKPFVKTFIFGEQNRRPFTNLWSTLYGVPLHRSMPRRNFARYLLALWITYTWILRTAYVGQLFHLLQDSRARSNIKTINEIMSKNYTFFTYPILIPVLFDESNRPAKISFVNNAENSLSHLFYRLGREESNFVVTVLGHIIRYSNQQPANRLYPVNILPEPILMAPLTLFMPKHSYLSLEINDLLMRIMSAGLISHFEEISLGDGARRKRRAQEPTALSLWLLMGIFVVYLILLVLCCLVFLLEFLSPRWRLTRRLIDFFNC